MQSQSVWNSSKSIVVLWMGSALVDLPSSRSCMGPPTAGHPRFGRTRCCLHGTPEELGARSIELAASQRSAAADVGHGAGARCRAVAGATPEFREVTLEGTQIPQLS